MGNLIIEMQSIILVNKSDDTNFFLFSSERTLLRNCIERNEHVLALYFRGK